MTPELQRKVENFTFGMQTTLAAIDDLKEEKFYARDVKFHCNKLLDIIEKMFEGGFKQSDPESMDYYLRQNDWLKIASETFHKFETLSEESKLRYLTAYANFNTINLR